MRAATSWGYLNPTVQGAGRVAEGGYWDWLSVSDFAAGLDLAAGVGAGAGFAEGTVAFPSVATGLVAADEGGVLEDGAFADVDGRETAGTAVTVFALGA